MNKNVLIRWIPSIILMVIIYSLSAIPSESMLNFGLLDLLVKKGSHILGYGILTIAYLFGLGKTDLKTAKLAVLLSFLYALTDEWHQSYVLGRNGSLWDVGIDTFGSVLAVFLVLKSNLFRKFNL